MDWELLHHPGMNSNYMTGVPDVVGARTDRVRGHTSSRINEKIAEQTMRRVDETVAAGRSAIIARLHQLDREWSVDRALMANFAVLGGSTFALSQKFRGWRWVTASQLGFLMMHAVVGWCPPLPAFRALGFRTSREIAAERFALVLKLDVIENPHHEHD